MRYFLVETMPEYLRSQHRSANNWGRWPANGSERDIVLEGNEPDGTDEYDHVIREATESEFRRWNT